MMWVISLIYLNVQYPGRIHLKWERPHFFSAVQRVMCLIVALHANLSTLYHKQLNA